MSYVCRCCGSNDATTILDQGDVPLANDFSDRNGNKYPLSLVMCDECHLLQVGQTAAPDDMFVEYPWVSGTSATLHRYADKLANSLASNLSGSVLEIACNDGVLLKCLQDAGFSATGVDPSEKPTAIAREKGLDVHTEFFSEAVAKELVANKGMFDVVVARNVVGHVHDCNDMMRGVEHALAPNGTFVVESPYAGFLRDQIQYDTVFHEHVCYFTIHTLSQLLMENGLHIHSIDFCEMNGGSFVVRAKKEPGYSSAELALMQVERLGKLNNPDGWDYWSISVSHQKAALKSMLVGFNDEGLNVTASGAAAKFMTMLATAGIDKNLISCVGDDNPMKQGKFCPGTSIPIESQEEMLTGNPDVILIGAWNMQADIIPNLRKLGFAGKICVPAPYPKVLEA